VSYTVLAVKWRPKRFDALVGQADVVKALVNSLDAGRLHHAYLFAGTRGVGKTTVARILAKALNCESGVSAEPCGECEACVAIDQGRFVDLIEVDAASRTRVDDTRELLDNVQYMPTRGRYKVYLIDEVHMLSTHSFNALLKTLEEPPPHVKFLFATTDPQKLPVTVLSRCLQFNLKKLPVSLIQGQLATILEAEGIPAEEEGLRAIARSAEGSMRDGLSLLDQAIAFGGGSIVAADVKQMLGTIDRDHVERLLTALAAQDGASLLQEVERIDTLALDFGAVLDELMSALQRIAVVQLVGGAGVAEGDADWVELAGGMSPEDVQLYYQIALNGRRDINVCRDERMSLEMTLLRMLAFRPADPEQKDSRQAELATTRPRQRRSGAAAAARSSPAGADSEPVEPPAERVEPPGADAPRAASASSSRSTDLAIDDWPALVRAAGLRGAVRNLADHCELGSVSGGRIELVLLRDKAHFNTNQLRERLRDAIAGHLGRRISLKIEVGEPPRATPAQVRRANEDEQMRQTREAIEQDPNIRAVQDAFDAVLEPDSIQPAQPKR
jgi:DNA polymerase-3 subunit gamma/tau